MAVFFSRHQWAADIEQVNLDEPGGRQGEARCGRGGLSQLDDQRGSKRHGGYMESPLETGQQECSG